MYACTHSATYFFEAYIKGNHYVKYEVSGNFSAAYKIIGQNRRESMNVYRYVYIPDKGINREQRRLVSAGKQKGNLVTH